MREALFLFSNWATLGKEALYGVLSFVALAVLLRISGKRTLSKMGAYDLILTVAIGSTLATVVLSPSTGVAEGWLPSPC
ncbi:MAG TPA: hypothetical protein VFZ25_10710 [Chloroflexota bacterium]|nr:hypothetical protein [Chloroflexota bacterium]